MLHDVSVINVDGQTALLRSAFDMLPVVPGISPIARGVYPRLLVSPEGLEPLRSRIRTDLIFQARWQTAVQQFESPKSTWNSVEDDPFACAFAAFLAMVRRPNDDLGLAWSQPWQTYVDRATHAAAGWTREGRHEQKAIATAVIFDCLYGDLSASERAQFLDWIELGFAKNSYMAKGVEVYDNGASDDHAAKLLCALVSAKAQERLAEAYEQTMLVADTNDWMGYGFGLGREWHEGYTSRHGVPFLLLALKNAGGYTDAETIDHFLVQLRDSWELTRQSYIPHPSIGAKNGAPWTTDKFHTQDPIKGFHRQINVGALMAWAGALLPGKVRLDGASDQAALASSASAYLGHLRQTFDALHPATGKALRDVLDVTLLGRSTSTHVARFWAFPAWLVIGTPEAAPVDEKTAGIPMVRRYWPGTLDWTFIHSDDFAPTSGSVIRYTHRRYGASQYEEGTKQNGRWHVHRDGPLLIQRGETGHGVNTRKNWWCANGVVGFVDPNLYPEFTYTATDDGDNGGIRNFVSENTKAQMLAEPTADFGAVTAWYADDKAVAITSDLTRSYNSTLVQFGPNKAGQNEPKIARFIREFVVVRRGADSTDREKVFTYDRIELLDTRFEPRYALCPAANPSIDGKEVEVRPWGPDRNDPGFDWYAQGPTHWDYPGATRMIYDNRSEPKAPIPGNGKVCVTWLEPSAVKVRKAGGLNAVSKVAAKMNGHPFFSPWRGWSGKEEWAAFNNLEERAYVGLYTVTVAPETVTKDVRFLMACEVMAASDTPSTAEQIRCDPSSVAVRCGSSVVVFGKEGERNSGWVDVPAGVELVIVVNHKRDTPLVFQASAGVVGF